MTPERDDLQISAKPLGPQLKKEIEDAQSLVSRKPELQDLTQKLDRIAKLISVAQV
jgi:hypothetical protein